MTQAQEAYLSVAKSADVPKLMQEYGFEFVGPSAKDVFMFKTRDLRAWLLTDMRGKIAPCRMVLPSHWSEENLSVLMGEIFCPHCNRRERICICEETGTHL